MQSFHKLSSSKILIVDDNVNSALTLKEMLELEGYQAVEMTADPFKAASHAETWQPNLLILDYHMPGMNGLELLSQLNRQNLLGEACGVIMLTGNNDHDLRVQALAKGAADFISKPFCFLEVKNRIRNLLEKSWLVAELAAQNHALEERVRERTEVLLHINDAITSQNERLRELSWIQSHVIRAPLARFMSIVDLLLQKGTVNAEERDLLLQQSWESAQELNELIQSINNLSKEAQLDIQEAPYLYKKSNDSL